MRRGFGTWVLRVLALAALVPSLGGCSGQASDEAAQRDSEAASAASRAEPSTGAAGCELLTSDEIQAAIGVAPDKSQEDTGVRGCSWFGADGRPLVGVVVGAAPRTYEEYMQNVREQMGPDLERVKMSRVEGVGDYAVWHAHDGPSYLNAAEDGELLNVMIPRDPASGKSTQEAAVELARKALPRL